MKSGCLTVIVVFWVLFDTEDAFNCYSCNSLLDSGCGPDLNGETNLERYAVDCRNVSNNFVLGELGLKYKPACVEIVVRRVYDTEPYRQPDHDMYGRKRLARWVYVRSCSLQYNDTCDIFRDAFQLMQTKVMYCNVCNGGLCNATSSREVSAVLPAVFWAIQMLLCFE